MTDFICPIIDPLALEAGMRFSSGSEYRLIARLGRGGMGEVWKAERISAAGHKQVVAMKFLSSSSSSGALDAEALRMSLLSHDNIVPFVDSGIDGDGRFFVAMAFVEGIDLDGLCRLVGMNYELAYLEKLHTRIPDKIVGFIMYMTLRALHYAHSFKFGEGIVGLIHRDVSPGNILLDEKGFVKLSDFGVAAVQGAEQESGGIAGKIPYLAPEILVESPFDQRADIYALGIVAYELLTGFNPNIRPAKMHSVLGAVSDVMLSLDRKLRLPHEVVEGIDVELSQIVGKMIERQPENRYESAMSVKTDFGAYLYNKGFGPTTDGLSQYLKLVSGTQTQSAGIGMESLRFFDWQSDPKPYLPHWKLTDAAKVSLSQGDNPCRK